MALLATGLFLPPGEKLCAMDAFPEVAAIVLPRFKELEAGYPTLESVEEEKAYKAKVKKNNEEFYSNVQKNIRYFEALLTEKQKRLEKLQKLIKAMDPASDLTRDFGTAAKLTETENQDLEKFIANVKAQLKGTGQVSLGILSPYVGWFGKGYLPSHFQFWCDQSGQWTYTVFDKSEISPAEFNEIIAANEIVSGEFSIFRGLFGLSELPEVSRKVYKVIEKTLTKTRYNFWVSSKVTFDPAKHEVQTIEISRKEVVNIKVPIGIGPGSPNSVPPHKGDRISKEQLKKLRTEILIK